MNLIKYNNISSTSILIILLITVLFAGNIEAELRAISEIPKPGLKQQDVDRADLIIIAKIKRENRYFFEMTEKGTIPWFGRSLPADVFRCRAEVIKAIKGRPPQEISVKFYLPDLDKRQWSVAVGRPVLLILTHVKNDNVYELAGQPESWLTLSDGLVESESNTSANAYISDVVLKILDNVDVTKPTAAELTAMQGASGNDDLLKQAYIQQSNFGILQALGTVSGLHLNSQEIREAIRKLWTSPTQELRMGALETSLSVGDSSVIGYCVSEWKNHPDDETLRMNMTYIISNAAQQLQKAGNLTGLDPFLNCDIPSVRSTSMLLLQEAKNPAFLPKLLAGLNDSDNLVKYHAMLGIYFLDPELFKEEKIPAPLIDMFNTKPNYYISIWKKWLSEGGLQKLQADLPGN